MPFTDPRDGRLFRLVRPGRDGQSRRHFYVCILRLFPKNMDPPLNVRFRLIFPRWDVIVIILSIFLLTYTYIEAKANYHRGSILVLRCAVSLSDQSSDTEREFHAAISCLPLGSSSHHSPLETAVTTVFLAPYSPYALLLSRCACFGLRPLPSNTPKPVGLFVIYTAQHYRALWR